MASPHSVYFKPLQTLFLLQLATDDQVYGHQSRAYKCSAHPGLTLLAAYSKSLVCETRWTQIEGRKGQTGGERSDVPRGYHSGVLKRWVWSWVLNAGSEAEFLMCGVRGFQRKP